MTVPTYVTIENPKDRTHIENLNDRFKNQLKEILSSGKTDKSKVKSIEKCLDTLTLQESKLKPYDLYRDGKLIN